MSNGAPNRIREIREQLGLSQAQLADKVGCSQTQIDRLEKGTRDLSDHWKRRLATAMGVAPWDLLPVDDQPPRITPEEQAILELYRGLTDHERAQFRAVAHALAKPGDDTKRRGNGGTGSG